MTAQEFNETFDDIVQFEYGVTEVQDTYALREALPLMGDSLDLVEFVMECEKRFTLADEVPDEVVAGWRTVGDARQYFRTRVGV